MVVISREGVFYKENRDDMQSILLASYSSGIVWIVRCEEKCSISKIVKGKIESIVALDKVPLSLSSNGPCAVFVFEDGVGSICGDDVSSLKSINSYNGRLYSFHESNRIKSYPGYVVVWSNDSMKIIPWVDGKFGLIPIEVEPHWESIHCFNIAQIGADYFVSSDKYFQGSFVDFNAIQLRYGSSTPPIPLTYLNPNP